MVWACENIASPKSGADDGSCHEANSDLRGLTGHKKWLRIEGS